MITSARITSISILDSLAKMILSIQYEQSDSTWLKMLHKCYNNALSMKLKKNLIAVGN